MSHTNIKELANRWTSLSCTLDGEPAKVTGRLLDYAIIISDDGSNSVEFSWDTVDRIMRRDRAFRSY